MTRFRAAILLTLLTLAWGRFASSADLSEHERSLLLAGIEDLLERLSLPGDAPEIATSEEKTLAGVTLVRTPVVLPTRAEPVLDWLNRWHRGGLVYTPPVSIRADSSGLSGVSVEIVAWHIRSTGGEIRADANAADEELVRLRDNLRWLDLQRNNSQALIDLVEALQGTETVFVSRASYQKNEIRVAGRSTDTGSAHHWKQQVEDRASRLNKKPRLHLGDLEAPRNPAEKPVTGLHMQDLSPAVAILAVIQATGADAVVAAGSGEPVSGFLPAADPATLLPRLLERLGLQLQRPGGVIVAAGRLSGAPPNADMFSERPVDLFHPVISGSRALEMLAVLSGAGWVPSAASSQPLIVAVRNKPARVLAALCMWALNLEPVGDKSLVTALAAGAHFTAPEGDPGDPVDLNASSAPLSGLIQGLSGLEEVVDCSGTSSLVDLHLRAVPAGKLEALLLASWNRTIQREGRLGTLGKIGTAPGPTACPHPGPEGKQAVVPELASVIRRAENYRALIREGQDWHWVTEGQKLEDGREVKRIRLNRVVMKDSKGDLQSLSPSGSGPGGCKRMNCRDDPEPTDTPLARLRLAATIRLGTVQAALVVDPHGNSYLVRKGHLVGTRCGRLTEVSSGSVRISLGCPGELDPPEARLILSPAPIDSTPPGR
jgi:hypothetical protein